MNMKDKAANNEANMDASRTSNSQELDLDGDDDEEFTHFFRQQPRSPHPPHPHFRSSSRPRHRPVDTDDYVDEDGTPNPPASPFPLPTREMEITNEDDFPMPASQMAAALEEMEEGSAMESPTAVAARLSSTGLGPTPPPARPASAREGHETIEDEEEERPAPANRSPLRRAGIEISDRDSPVPNEMPPVQAALNTAACEAHTAAAYEQMEHELRNLPSPIPLMPPVPDFQIAAAYEDEMEQNIKRSTMDAPPPYLTGAIFEDGGKGQMAYEKKKTIEEDDFKQAQDPPTSAVPRAPSPTPMGFENMEGASLYRKRERVRHQQDKILQQAQGPPTRAKASLKRKRKRVRRQQELILQKAHGSHAPAEEDAQHPSTNPPVRAQSLPAITPQPGAGATPLGRTQSVIMLPMRPPPRSMLPPSDDDDDVTTTPSVSSLQVLEGTLVEEPPPVPIYDAVRVTAADEERGGGDREEGGGEDPSASRWWRKRGARIVVVGLLLVIGGMGAVIGAILSSRGDDGNGDEARGTVGGSTGYGGGLGVVAENTNLPNNIPTNPPTNLPTNPPTSPPTNLPTNPPTNPPTNGEATPLPTNGATLPPTNKPTNSATPPPTNPPTDPPSLIQYTPAIKDWSTLNDKSVLLNSKNADHNIDSVHWIDQSEWLPWDNITYNPSWYTKSELADQICPGNTIRGLRDVFYKANPFSDPVNPTKAEVDNWHAIAINHVRALVGYSEEAYRIEPDQCLHVRALWTEERKNTEIWTARYPDNTWSSFIPDIEDQAPYLPDGVESCGLREGSEGLFNAAKSNIPWSIRFIRPLCHTLGAEGFWSGHTSPWFHRKQFGFSWRDTDPDNQNSNTVLVAKWSGPKAPSKYENPFT